MDDVHSLNELVDIVQMEYSHAAIVNLLSNAEIAADRGDFQAALSDQLALSLILLRKLRDEGLIDLDEVDEL